MTSEISVTGHTSRPSGYIVRKYKDPKDENSTFLPDEVYENDFKHGGLGSRSNLRIGIRFGIEIKVRIEIENRNRR
jgi:hypothetical protein